jgi:hypothetical protein
MDVELGQLDAGLFFISYQHDRPRSSRSSGASRRPDALNEYIKHTGSALFACPPERRKAATSARRSWVQPELGSSGGVRRCLSARLRPGRRPAVHLRGARRTSAAGRSSRCRSARRASAAWSSRPGAAAAGGRGRRRSAVSSTSCRRRWSSSRSGSPTTTARPRHGRSSWSRRGRAGGAASGADACGLAGEARPRLTPSSRRRWRRIVGRWTRRWSIPSVRRDRQAADRGLPPGHARPHGAWARAIVLVPEIALTPGGRALPGALRRTDRAAPLRA